MKILVYPKDANPYQSLLYGALVKLHKNTSISYSYNFPLLGSIPFFIHAPIMRLFGYRILHIHWPSFGTRLPSSLNKRLSYRVFLITLRLLRLLRFKIIWTVHNVLPHEAKSYDDISLSRLLATQSDANIVHSETTIQQMKDLGIPANDITIIPHGNYINAYPSSISDVEARSMFQINPATFVILFFGQIRPYKGIDDLLSAFKKIRNMDVCLVIAGNCEDEVLRQKIKDTAQQANVYFHDKRVEEKDVASYFQLCDVVCLPFRTITTSGSALLALSFGKPLIAPLSGSLTDLPHDCGYLYDPEDPNALLRSIKQSIRERSQLSVKGKSGLNFARTLDWNTIADKTYAIYQKVVS